MIIYLHEDIGNEAHASLMEQSFIEGYQSDGGVWGGEVRLRSGSLNDTFIEAVGANADLVVRGYDDAINQLGLANHYYPNVTLGMPPGTTSPYAGAVPHALLFISGGDAGVNETGGNTEFTVNDPITTETLVDELDRQDYALAYGTGQIAYIKDQVSGSVWEARARAQITGTNNGVWGTVGGFGAINVPDAIAYNLALYNDPFFTPGNMTLTRTMNIVDGVNDPIPNANSYNIYRNNQLLFNTTSLTFQDTINSYGTYSYQYSGVSNGLESNLSDVFEVTYPNPNTVYHDKRTYLGPDPDPSGSLEDNGRLYQRSEKYITETLIKLIRRLLKNSDDDILNKDLEYFSAGSGSVPCVHEQYADVDEKYPMVTVLATGGMEVSHGIDRMISEFADDNVNLGVRGLTKVVVNSTDSLLFQLPALEHEQVHKLVIQGAWTGIGNEGDITAKLYKNYDSTPELIAQVANHKEIGTSLQDITFHIDSTEKITADDVWIELSTTARGGYIIAIDPEAHSRYIHQTVETAGAPVGRVIFPPFIRIGGNRESNVSIKCSSKNDSSTCRDYAEYLETSLQTLITAQISRKDYNAYGMALSKLDLIGTTEWDDYEIYLKNVRTTSLDVRERGPNDKIYTVPLNIEIFSSWFRDYPAMDVKDFRVDIENYD